MAADDVGLARFDPTVLGAVQRYRLMVAATALLTGLLAVAYTLVQPERFMAVASITVPPQLSREGQPADQYLDSQVLLLSSNDVTQRALRIANGASGGPRFQARDFTGSEAALKVIPPENANPGVYGGSIITLRFTALDPRLAQIGANAVVQAFDDARTATIKAQGEATLAGIEAAIADARSQAQRNDLYNQRTQAIVNQQIDVAHHPTVVWAEEPEIPINGNSKRGGAIGLLAGLGLGAALAFVRASRRRVVHDPGHASAIYDAPLLADVPAPSRRRRAFRRQPLLPVAAMPATPVAEQFRFAASAIERLRVDRQGRLSVAVVSPRAGAGRTVVVANIALAIAEGDVRGLVLDADVDRRTLTRILVPDAIQDAGLRQVLSGRITAAECVRLAPQDGRVAVLCGGQPTERRAAGTALARAMDDLLQEATSGFDVVLVDTPAVLDSAHALEVLAACDVVVVFVRRGDSVADHFALQRHLQRLGSQRLGVVFYRGPGEGLQDELEGGLVGGRSEAPPRTDGDGTVSEVPDDGEPSVPEAARSVA